MPKIPPDQISPFGLADGNDRYLNSKQVRHRYGDVSDMWLWRRLRDDPNFPKPMEVAGRRFWKLAELVRWERERASEAA
jgi:predicted DNA-binding transcriptional regulator AlpA